MKKLLVTTVLLGLTACGGGSGSETTTNPVTPTPAPTQPTEPANGSGISAKWKVFATISLPNGDYVSARSDQQTTKIHQELPLIPAPNGYELLNQTTALAQFAQWTITNPDNSVVTSDAKRTVLLQLREEGTYQIEMCVSETSTIVRAYPFCANFDLIVATPKSHPKLMSNGTQLNVSASDLVSGTNAVFDVVTLDSSDRGLATVNTERTTLTYETLDEYAYLSSSEREEVRLNVQASSDSERWSGVIDVVINGTNSTPECTVQTSTITIPESALDSETFTKVPAGHCFTVGSNSLSANSDWQGSIHNNTTDTLLGIFRYAGVDSTDNVLHMKTTSPGKITLSKKLYGGDIDGNKEWNIEIIDNENVALPEIKDWKTHQTLSINERHQLSVQAEGEAQNWIYHWRVSDVSFGEKQIIHVATKSPDLNLGAFSNSKNVKVELVTDNRHYLKSQSASFGRDSLVIAGMKGSHKKYKQYTLIRGDEPTPPAVIVKVNGQDYKAGLHRLRLDRSEKLTIDGSASVYNENDAFLKFHHIKNFGSNSTVNWVSDQATHTYNNTLDVMTHHFCITGKFPWTSSENSCVKLHILSK
ncbi:hypothetical protein Q8W40_04195 [Vibrio penaeicida]|uniref:hypothetical protein n=1 Tax=Vibrio penaeicida TaxID=104609 RepID=UPI0027377271|nr:hypothetical protein [Vibrio penaeicida]MDP2571373.1 hypothetical protein [Vibrio penaeicida]